MTIAKAIEKLSRAPDNRGEAIKAGHELLDEIAGKPEIAFAVMVYDKDSDETSTNGRASELVTLIMASSLLIDLMNNGHRELEPAVAFLGHVIGSAEVEGEESGHGVH